MIGRLITKFTDIKPHKILTLLVTGCVLTLIFQFALDLDDFQLSHTKMCLKGCLGCLFNTQKENRDSNDDENLKSAE